MPIGGVEEDCGIKLKDSSGVLVMPKAEYRTKYHGLIKLHNTGELIGVGLDETKRDAGMRISKLLTGSHRGENIRLHIGPEPRIQTVWRSIKLIGTPKLAIGIKGHL